MADIADNLLAKEVSTYDTRYILCFCFKEVERKEHRQKIVGTLKVEVDSYKDLMVRAQ